MPSPADFMSVRPPGAASYQGPDVDFSWLSNLLPNYYKAQMAQNDLALQRMRLGALQQEFGQGAGQQAQADQGPAPAQQPASNQGGGTIADAFKNAIFGQESNYGRKPSTSSAGAVGPMQILPSTFRANAQPGEDINNRDDNMRVGNRILDKYLQQYNGDWARAATAYYSGEGNVAPPGSPTPWKVNKEPKGGPSVAQYVQQVGARMGQDRMPVNIEVRTRTPTQEATADASGTSAPAPNEPTSVGGPPPFAPPRQAAASSPSTAGPQNIMLANATPNVGGLMPQPSSTVAPTSSAEVAGAQGSGGMPSPVAGPITPQGRDNLAQGGSPPQRVAQTTRPEDAPEVQELNAQIRDKQKEVFQTARRAALLPELKPEVETLQKQVDDLRQLRQNLLTRYGTQQTEQRRIDLETEAAKRRGEDAAKIKTAQDEEADQLKYLRGAAEEGIDARGHIGQLDAIKELGRRAPYGQFVQVKQLLGRYGIETKDLTDIQAYQSAIDFFAPQLRPPGSGRLMSNEMTGFKSALGGLLTTPEGREVAVNNLKLMSQYKIKVGDIARDASLTPTQRMDKIAEIEFPKLQTTLPGKDTQGVTTKPGGKYIWDSKTGLKER